MVEEGVQNEKLSSRTTHNKGTRQVTLLEMDVSLNMLNLGPERCLKILASVW